MPLTTINLGSGDTLPVILPETEKYLNQTVTLAELTKKIKDNEFLPRFRIFVLYPDETINYEIPINDIKVGGSYNENYQNGQRRTLSFSLINESGAYTPGINNFWAGTRLRLEFGLESFSGDVIWTQKGVYVITQASPSYTSSGKEVQITANDKFSLFESGAGILESSYEIPIDTPIEDLIRDILLKDGGNGYPLDSQQFFYHSSFKGKTTQALITKNAGENLGSILTDLATQLSSEVFYNSQGNLTFVPIDEVSLDNSKPLLYKYSAEDGDINQLSFAFDYSTIVNRVIVIGNSSNGGTYEAIALNEDPGSPLCYQRIGYRTGSVISDSNISSQILAEERAAYELRQQLILKSSSTAEVLFNPLLEVNNLIIINSEFYSLVNERFLIQSISCNIGFSGSTSITFSNLKNLPFTTKQNLGGYKV